MAALKTGLYGQGIPVPELLQSPGVQELRYIGFLPLLFFVVGSLLVYFGIRQRLALRRFQRRATWTTGTVTEVRSRWVSSRDSDGMFMYFPVVRFTRPDRHEVETEVFSGSSPAPAHRGDTVTVLYDPRRPVRARIDNFWADGTLVIAVLVVIGGLFATIGLAGVVAFVALGGLG